MAVDPPTIAELITDKDFTSAALIKLRDDLETNHDHTLGNGRVLDSDAVPDGILNSSHFVSGAVGLDELGVTVQVAEEPEDGTDLEIIADGTERADAGLAVTLTVDVASVLEIVYLYRMVRPLLDVLWRVRVQLNGTAQAVLDQIHRSEIVHGNTIRNQLLVGSGTHTLRPSWQSVTTPGGDPRGVVPKRIFAVVAWAQ